MTVCECMDVAWTARRAAASQAGARPSAPNPHPLDTSVLTQTPTPPSTHPHTHPHIAPLGRRGRDGAARGAGGADREARRLGVERGLDAERPAAVGIGGRDCAGLVRGIWGWGGIDAGGGKGARGCCFGDWEDAEGA